MLVSLFEPKTQAALTCICSAFLRRFEYNPAIVPQKSSSNYDFYKMPELATSTVDL